MKLFRKISFAFAFTFTVSNISNISLWAFSDGSGTAADPYQIKNKADMELLADSVNNGKNWSRNKYFKVMNDITDTVRTVIGINIYSSYDQSFQGHFDGNGFKIVLGIDNPPKNGGNIGLFGNVANWNNISISNVIIEGYIKSNADMIGGIAGNCGLNINGVDGIRTVVIIKNCINNCDITGMQNINSLVGGMVGQSTNADSIKIENCINNGKISANASAGGMAIAGGMIGNGTEVTNCINTGVIFSTNIAGGILGYSSRPAYKPFVSNCINAGFIVGNQGVGGIIGNANIDVKNCINTGVVKGNTNVGGIIGSVGYSTIISNCYYDKQMCVYGGINNADANGQAEGYLTKELIGNNLQSKLGTVDWTYKNNLYPTLKVLENATVAMVAASPAYLCAIDINDYDKHNNIRHHFEVSTANNVNW